MEKRDIKVTIINDSSRVECEAECGTDWSSPEAEALASQRIKERFGDKIQLVSIDLSKSESGHDVLEWNEIINNKDFSLPLLLINGQLRITGQFDIRQLMDVIEVETELGA